MRTLISCESCGQSLSARHRFCSYCGERVTEGTASETGVGPIVGRRSHETEARAFRPDLRIVSERKQITALFADLCNSTALLADSDPEEARSLLERALRQMCLAVESYGGTISQLLGDGVLALFGAPAALEDHALRACLAALAIQQRSVDQSLLRDGNLPMLVRIGIHSGEVVVGAANEFLWSHYRADGKAIHLASRLERMATPGTILISEATLRLAADQLTTVPLGSRQVPGFSEPVVVHELVSICHRSAAAPFARQRHWAPMIGRSQALRALEAASKIVLSRSMRMIGLRGEAGIGKSRLIAEFCRVAEPAGFKTCVVCAHAYLSSSALSVIAELIRELLRIPPCDSRVARRTLLEQAIGEVSATEDRHLPALADLLDFDGADAEWPTLNPSQRRRRIADAVHWLVKRTLSEGPLLLVIEDIFVADVDSQRQLDSVLMRLQNEALLVCATYRNDFEHAYAAAPWFIEHTLGPLDKNEMWEMVHSMLGAHPSLLPVIEQLVGRSEGNPFFLEQLSVALIDDESIVGSPGEYRLARPAGQLRVPASISAVVGARVDRLPGAIKATLELAAVLGGRISRDLIGEIQSIDPVEAEAHLARSVASGLLRAPLADDETYCFRHALVQDVLVAGLTRIRKKLLHRNIFDTLRLRFGDSSSVEASATLTHHAFAGERWIEAAGYAVGSMRRSIARSANREALRLYDVGIAALGNVHDEPGRMQLELRLRLEALGALMPIGELQAIVSNLDVAEDIAKRLGDARRMGTVALQLAVILWMLGEHRRGLEAASAAERSALLIGHRRMQMAAAQARVILNHALGRYQAVVADAQMIEREFSGELRGRTIMTGWAVNATVNARIFMAGAMWQMGNLEGAQAACDEACRELGGREHPYSRALADFGQGNVWLAQGRCTEAAALLEAAASACRHNDVPTMLPTIVASWGEALTRNGQVQEGLALLQRAVDEKMFLSGGRYGEHALQLNLARALCAAGRYAEAAERAGDVCAAASLHGELGHEAEAIAVLAEALDLTGDKSAVRTCLQRGIAAANDCSMWPLAARLAERLSALEKSAIGSPELASVP